MGLTRRQPLPRGKPLAPGAPLRRKTALRAKTPPEPSRSPLARGARLAPVSKRRRAALPTRAEVRRQVLARDGGCVARRYGWTDRCWHPADEATLDVHEVVPRGRWRAGWLVPDNCVTLCRKHHDRATLDRDGEATAVGLLASAPPVRSLPGAPGSG